MKFIVGLGNPGRPYAHTRHNVGYQVLDAWCDQQHYPAVPPGAISRALQGVQWYKAGPMMNVCGSSVQRRMEEHAVAVADALIICDDLHLPLGQLRIRSDGSAGGHHGLESIIAALGTDAFPRLRLGIGAVPPGMEGAVFVLNDFTAEERPVIATACATAAQAVEVWLQQGINAAMTQFNRRAHQEKA